MAKGVGVLSYPFFDGFSFWEGVSKNSFFEIASVRARVRASVRPDAHRSRIGRFRLTENDATSCQNVLFFCEIRNSSIFAAASKRVSSFYSLYIKKLRNFSYLEANFGGISLSPLYPDLANGLRASFATSLR